jgi:hypothetical protein
MAESVEVLIDDQMADRGKRMISAMMETCPIKIKSRLTYKGDCDLLLTYGTGHPMRRPWWANHRKKGKHCVGLDLGYWGHDQGAMRVTIDDDHPQKWIRPESPERWDVLGIDLRSDFKEGGPAIIIGMGAKAVKVHGYRQLQWERKAIAQARSMGYTPIFKPKRARYPIVDGVQSFIGPIEEALKGAGLVICRHSNAAVDACIAGVPVICEDGAAFALYSHTMAPDQNQRLQFLRSLAWWNWTPEESAKAWNYILNRLS